jgi:hypothetical protein
MEKNFKINPIGLKGREINERMRQLMGVSTINENLSRSTVELTKMGPDGKVYGIVRENHEYYIKVADKSSDLTVEDFKYIGGLQNKKSEAYPSYAKATKHLNLKFNSICESYDIVNTFNVFVDDNLLAEHHPYKADQKLSATKGMGDAQEYVVNKAGKPLSADAKVGKEKDGFGDNLADGKVMDELEDVKLTEDEMAIDAMLMESDYLDEEEDKDNPWAICTASVGREDKEKYEACVRKVKKEKGIKEELKGNQSKIDMNKDGKIDGEDFKILRKGKTNENEMGDLPKKPTLKTAKTNAEWIDALDDASAKEILQSIYDELGAPVVKIAKKALGFIGGPEVRDALNKKDDLGEEMTLEQIQEAIADLKKKL